MSSSDEEPDHVCKPVLATAHGASWTECEICSKALPDAEPFQEEPADARGRASDKVEITRGRLAALEAIEEWAAGALAREAASVEPTLCAHPKGDGFCGEPVVPPGDACRDHEPTRLDVAAPPQGAGPGWDESTLTMLAEGALCVLEGRGLLRQMGELAHQGAVEGLVDAFRLDLRTTAAPPHGGTDAARYDATDGGGLLHLCDECHDERRAAYAPAAAPHGGEAGPVVLFDEDGAATAVLVDPYTIDDTRRPSMSIASPEEIDAALGHAADPITPAEEAFASEARRLAPAAYVPRVGDRVAVTMLGRLAIVEDGRALVDIDRPGGSIGLRIPLVDVRPTSDNPTTSPAPGGPST